jgi:7,8-dihydro-6-hydroxymethylpterin dimethyltransferase
MEAKRRKFATSQQWESTEVSTKDMERVEQMLSDARERMGEFYLPNQVLGRRETIGCVALEITQRCNLDCTLCYLSENSENTKDVPIAKLKQRIDKIYETYGVNTAVQITGGDPTMRNRKELIEIVRYCRSKGLVPALFTNGILASRRLLTDLANVGLSDVAFHVDLTQERKGYQTERELNQVRQEYIERARGLPITVIFNTTVHDENMAELPELVDFFVKNSDVVRMVSFQMQADTGRGELRKRGEAITLKTVRNKINRGAKHQLAWDAIMFGHQECNRYAPTFIVNGKVYNVIDDEQLFTDFLEDFKHVTIDRRDSIAIIAWHHLKICMKHPKWLARGLKYGASKLWEAKWDLIRARGRFNKVSFFIHNFMDADNLVCERVDTCSFMVMTEDGPMSMCAHNAKRDEYITKPIVIETENGQELWNPLIHDKEQPSRQYATAYDGGFSEKKPKGCCDKASQKPVATEPIVDKPTSSTRDL